jgi:NYN domain
VKDGKSATANEEENAAALLYPPRHAVRERRVTRARTAEVIKTEEKGSDVNLASLLVADGFRGNYEVAIVISNDSDLVLPIQIVRDELQLPVGVVNPRGNPSRELLAVSTFFKRIRVSSRGRSRTCDLGIKSPAEQAAAYCEKLKQPAFREEHRCS